MMRQAISYFVIFFFAVAVGAFLFPADGLAQPPTPGTHDTNMTSQHGNLAGAGQVNDHDGAQTTQHNTLSSQISGLANNALVLSVHVNEDDCAHFFIQCTADSATTGHSAAAASTLNHNPVHVVVTVLKNGVPVTGIPSTGFFLSLGLVAQGGGAIAVCPNGGSGCASQADLHDVGFGVYEFWAHPSLAGNWRSGSYFSTLRVTDNNGDVGYALVEVAIP